MTRKAAGTRRCRNSSRSRKRSTGRRVGKKVRVLVEEPGVARTERDAPEIDGTVFVDKKLPVGEFAEVTISDWRGYDLVAAR